MKGVRVRNSGIELFRALLMFGICMCHSVGAGGYIWAPLRNVCMMCTVGFIFITGWFGIHFSLKRIVRLLGIALFALAVVILMDWWFNGGVTKNPATRLIQWWFLNAYLALMIISPVLNSIVTCLESSDAKVQREAFFAVALVVGTIWCVCWPMHCHWIPRVRFFLTLGCPCQFGCICAIYLAARVVRVCRLLDKIPPTVPILGLIVSFAFAMYSYKFSYYNSPISFIFAVSSFYFFKKFKISDPRLSKMVLLVAPSCFFIYLYHSHYDPGFAILAKLQGWMVDHGIWIPLAWFATAFIIFCVGLLLDAVRRMSIYRLSSLISHPSSPQ